MNEICKPYDEKMKKTIEVVKAILPQSGRAVPTPAYWIASR